MRVQVPYNILFVFGLLFLSNLDFPQDYTFRNQPLNSINNSPVFENITIEDGLPENTVTCIMQDYLGYLWLGTQSGLVRYDGYSMKIFRPEDKNLASISDTRIVTIFETKDKNLLIGTFNGLNIFNRANETFEYYKNDPYDINSINSNYIHCIYEDKVGRLWIGTQEGLNLFDPAKKDFKRYYFCYDNTKLKFTPAPNKHNLCINAIIEDPSTNELLIGTEVNGLWRFNVEDKALLRYKFSSTNVSDKKIGYIQSFYKSKNGKIWMVSFHTLSRLDPLKKEFRSYIDFPITEEEKYPKDSYACGTVIEDRAGLIWCGFFSGEKGIFCLDTKTGEYRNFKLSIGKQKHSYSNAVYNLYEDNSGIIWVGTWMAGLDKFDRNKNKFQLLKSPGDYSLNTLSHSDVYSVIYDHKGSMWFCTQNALNRYDIKEQNYKYYLKHENCITQFPYIGIQDTSGDLWLGTSSCGLVRFSTQNSSYRFYLNDLRESENLLNKKITRLFQDHLGYLWIGTEGFGIYKYDISKKILTNYKHNPNDSSSLRQDQIRWIYEDHYGIIWVGTNAGGLNKYDRETDKFTFAGFNSVSVIYEDKRGNLWVADYLSGLHLFDRDKKTIIGSYYQKDDIASNAIFGILEDDHYNLWLGTQRGLSKFNTITKAFKHYYKEDGIPDNWFEPASTYGKGPNGEMYFSTKKGLMVFQPDSIKDDPTTPQVVLIDITLFNRPNEKLNYNKIVSDIKEVTFPYDQNDLRFDYVGLQYSEPLKNTYKYILENFDEDWVEAATQRNATYTNLNPGEYTFKVKAANRDGFWSNNEASIKIIITPPWWKTNLAYILFALILISITYLTWRLQLKRIRIKHKYEMSRFESEKLHEVDELKSHFFTNISHEFRTPLTLILGPVQQIVEKLHNGKMKDDLLVVHRNANKLLGLVNQILDISKIESGSMKLEATPVNIIPVLKSLVMQFSSYAERKRIELKFSTSDEEIIVYIDQEKFDKIITNIISNAFKFTPEDGKIEVNIKLNHPSEKMELREGFVKISIRDSGIGISKEKIPNIFNRFYQVNGSHKREQEGTGIGLSITKELVELHTGKINVVSEEGKGTIFTIIIPLGKEHLKPEEIYEGMDGAEHFTGNIMPGIDDSVKQAINYKIDNNLFEKVQLPLLLIVEDNTDVRNYISGILKNDFRIMEAVDGEDGWTKSKENIPDLIISDVMMPKIDGFELCKKLKTDERTSHIPVIILTAKATSRDKIEGYETGADDYIMKPFDTKVLQVRIKNLIEQRKRIQEHFKAEGIIHLDKTKITSIDKTFLQKVFKIISENISDSSFNVHSLAKEAAVSYQVLHKKIVSLTGEPPVELIRRVRLKRAVELLANNSGNISEIAIEVGFNNPAYFSECFKKQFGYSPSQYNHKSIKN